MVHPKLKVILKRSPVIYGLNSFLKGRQVTAATARLARHYARLAARKGITYSEAWALKQLHSRLERRAITVKPLPKGQLRIFWVGANWNQDNSGFLAALSKLGEGIAFRNANGAYGLLLEGKRGPISGYDPNVARENSKNLIDQVEGVLKDGPLHLLIGQMWANFVLVEALRHVQDLGVVTVNVSMDDRLPDLWGTHKGIRLGSVGLCDGLDLVLTSSPDCCLRYSIEGCPSLFWPMASSPEIFKTYPENEKKFDVSFVGNKYGLRGKIILRIQRAGIRVESFGSGWPNGPVTAEQAAEIFGRSRIVLGVGNVAHSKDILTLKLRDFDATMAGALYITHRNPDLLTLYEEGKEIECYLTIDECIRKIRYYLDHAEHRMAVATAGASRARREHTWERRLATALSCIGFLPAQPNV